MSNSIYYLSVHTQWDVLYQILDVSFMLLIPCIFLHSLYQIMNAFVG